jgi:azurin
MARHLRWIVLLCALTVTSRGSALSQPPDISTIEITVSDNMRFTPSEIHVRPGQPIRVVLRSVGAMPKTALAHNFVLLKPGTSPRAFVNKVSVSANEPDLNDPAVKAQIIVATPLVGSGETTDTTFQAPSRPGEYDFVCTFRGHFNLGMKGQLIVK